MENQTEAKQIYYVPAYPGMDCHENPEDQIDIFVLWNILWSGKFFIIGFTLLATLAALAVVVYRLPVTYQSQAVISQSNSGGNKMGGLAALAGSLPIPINLPGGEGGNQLLVFLQSRSLKLKLIEKFDLLPRLYSDLWDPETKRWKVEEPKQIPTPVVAIQQKRLDQVFQVVQDDKTQLTTLTWVDTDPAFAAEMLKQVIAELDYYLAHEYVSDAKRERLFVEKQLETATRSVEKWERQVPSEEIPLAKIKREMMAESAVYAELRKQVELARLTEEKEIVNFKIVDPPFVPERRYSPKTTLICALAFSAAGFVAVAMVFIYHAVRLGLKRRKDEQASATVTES